MSPLLSSAYCKKNSFLEGINNAIELCAGSPDNDGNGLSDAGGDFCRFDEGWLIRAVPKNGERAFKTNDFQLNFKTNPFQTKFKRKQFNSNLF